MFCNQKPMDTCTRSSMTSKTSTHPTQGSMPFSATYSLGLCLPFQCCSRCAKKKTSPSKSICEVPSYTRFIKLVQIQFHSKPVQTKEKICSHSRPQFQHNKTWFHSLCDRGDHCTTTLRMVSVGKQPRTKKGSASRMNAQRACTKWNREWSEWTITFLVRVRWWTLHAHWGKMKLKT